MDTIELKIKGMGCGSCVSSVTHALQRVPGVDAVDVDLARGIARVSGNAQAAPANSGSTAGMPRNAENMNIQSFVSALTGQ